MTGDIENMNVGESSTDALSAEVSAYVSAALLTASAALEAYINEVFINGQVFPVDSSRGLPEELWDTWWEQVERKPMLEKYNLALELRKQTRFSKDKAEPENQPYVSANILINVRNALLHFKPQWDDEAKTHHNIAMDLRNEQVSLKSSGNNPPLFPHDFMSHDIARWAVKTAWQFIEIFSQRSGIPNNYAYAVDDVNLGYPTWPTPL